MLRKGWTPARSRPTAAPRSAEPRRSTSAMARRHCRPSRSASPRRRTASCSRSTRQHCRPRRSLPAPLPSSRETGRTPFSGRESVSPPHGKLLISSPFARVESSGTPMTASPSWYARGLIFENCSCALVCPGHMHFSQNCTHERCKGYWAVRIDEGAFGEVLLAGTRAVVAFDTPQRMIDGGWLETIIIDERASDEQRRALETILMGRAGGPWEKLASFVATRQPTEFRAIAFEDEGPVKRGSIVGRLKTVVTQIR